MPRLSRNNRQKIEIGVKIIDEETTSGYHLVIELHQEEMECRASVEIDDPQQAPLASKLITRLKSKLAPDTIDEEQVALLCESVARGYSEHKFLIARGKQASRGPDGWFEFAVRTADAEAEYLSDARGTVDLRTRHTFSNIEPGMLIGTIHPPEVGEPGHTVTGLPIPALQGEPLQLIAGEGVEIREENQVFALRSGRAVFEDNRLSISDEYIIGGDLDLSVGNIDFQGFVEIKGDVLDDFSVRASKGIKVNGSVGTSRLESEGSVQIGSMSGGAESLVRCGGDLIAKHLNGVTVEALGNVLVSSEIRNSLVKSGGRVSVDRGTIAGGTTIALEGIEARQVGTPSGLATRLIAGVYFPDEDLLDNLRRSLQGIEQQLERVSNTLGPTRRQIPTNSALQDALAVRIRVLSQRLDKLKIVQQSLSEQITNFKRQEQPSANPKINILKSLMEGTIIRLGRTIFDVQHERNTPTSIIEAQRTGELKFLSLTPLRISAGQLQSAELDTP